MSPNVLEGKLDCAETCKPEQAWNMARWPNGMDGPGPHRLFVASGGQWLGYFIISPEALFLPEDEKTPYVLLFDTRTWTEIKPAPARRFRGFTYKIPTVAPANPP